MRIETGDACRGPAEMLFPKTRRKILALFFLHPDRQFYFREIAAHIGTTQGQVLRELRAMHEVGLITMKPLGRHKFYQVNRECPIYDELSSIVRKTFGIADIIRDTLAAFVDQIRLAFIYGSAARGRETGESDVDLMVVGPITLRKLSVALDPVEKELGREINPTLYTPEQFERGLTEKNHFIRSVLKTELIYLVGTPDDVKAMAGPRTT